MKERPEPILAFAHIGDLHLTEPGEANFADLRAIVAEIETECARNLDFVVLPGDIAENGRPAQYRLAATALAPLRTPVHAIPGDHDMEQGGLAAFHAELAPDALPKSLSLKGCRCLFLDVCSQGKGGPDFRLGRDQLAWLERELRNAGAKGETPVVFMHVYPADLKGDGEAERLNALFAEHSVAFVDMGHTHYNEIANDGGTIFAATRSTGQVEEGPVGYSFATVDGGVVSWRFKRLGESFPFVMITSPADFNLLRGNDQVIKPNAAVDVRAIVFGRDVGALRCRFEGGAWTPMQPAGDGRAWSGRLVAPERQTALLVEATAGDGRASWHAVKPAFGPQTFLAGPRKGSDAASIGAWPANGIFGAQLGPNRNGRRW